MLSIAINYNNYIPIKLKHLHHPQIFKKKYSPNSKMFKSNHLNPLCPELGPMAALSPVKVRIGTAGCFHLGLNMMPKHLSFSKVTLQKPYSL